jgi:hypothetical protein
MRKLLLVIMMTLLGTNISAQNFEKSFINYKQNLVSNTWGEKEITNAYFKFEVKLYDKYIHIHDDNGIHLDTHIKKSFSELNSKVDDWERSDFILIVDKDYNNTISVGTEITFRIWTNKTKAFYELVVNKKQILYTIYKHEVTINGITETYFE